MKIESVPVAGITVGTRHRTLDQDKVLELATSIEDVGLLQPITVHKADDGTLSLVAGHHRLEAVKALDWTSIDAVFIPGDEASRKMAELAENLHRAELTKEQRDEHIRRYAELLKSKEAEAEIQVAHGDAPEIGYKKPPAQKKGIASKVAAATGLSKSTINRALNPKPERIPAAVKAVAEALEARAAEKVAAPQIDLGGRDPEAFNRSLHFVAAIEDYAKEIRAADMAVLESLSENQVSKTRKAITEIANIHSRVIAGVAPKPATPKRAYRDIPPSLAVNLYAASSRGEEPSRRQIS